MSVGGFLSAWNETGSATLPMTLTVPVGVTVGHTGYIVCGWADTSGNTPPVIVYSTTGTGVSVVLVASRVDSQNMGIALYKVAGAVAGDVLTFTLSVAKLWQIAGVWFTGVTGNDGAGAVSSRAGVSTMTTCLAAGASCTEVSSYLLTISLERTTATGTTVTGTTRSSVLFYQESTLGSAVSIYVGQAVGPASPGVAPDDTVSYSGNSGNGSAFQLPLRQLSSASSVTVNNDWWPHDSMD